MNVNHGELLRTVDSATLGQRLRDARTARGWTQAELAGDDITVSYVSRIESGTRRPNMKVLTALATRLGTTVEHLLRGVSTSEYDEIRLGLNYAELALETGEAVDAERQAREQLARAEAAELTELVERGRYLLGRALEATGQLDEAIELYEKLVDTTTGLPQIEAGIALTRCHRDSDDLNLAIEAGERVQAAIAEAGLEKTDEAVRLTMTIAGAYAMRGDVAHATRIGKATIAVAEELGSPTARAAAYWNASNCHADRGDIEGALPLATRALNLLREGSDARNIARLRLQLGDWQLQQRPPQVEEGISNMRQAREDLTHTSATKAELAAADVRLARGLVAAGDPAQGLEVATAALLAAPDRGESLFAEATVARALALDALGDTEAAREACYDAMASLEHADPMDRDIAQAWLDLAEVLEATGDAASALKAMRQVTISTGLRSARRAPTAELNAVT